MSKFIPISAPSITDIEIKLVTAAVKSKWVSSLGEYIDRFETEFANFCGTRFAIATSNGTTALHLALVAAGVGPGDEVIIPDFTFVATANAVTYTGAIPVLVDIDAATLCIDPERVRQAVTPRTKAIIPVHIFGHPADMRAIEKISKEYSLLVFEDAAEAHGAEINGRRVGSFGMCAAFSFYGNKIITCGEGGMITTNNEEFCLRARHLRDHAMSKARRYWHDAVGFNYRMTNLQASLGVAQMGRIEEILSKKRKIFELYRQGLKGHPCGVVNQTAEGAKNVYWMVYFRILGMTDERRADIMERLRNFGIDSRPFFYPLSDMPMYAGMPSDTPVTHRIHAEGFCLPSYFDLTEDDVARICQIMWEIVV